MAVKVDDPRDINKAYGKRFNTFNDLKSAEETGSDPYANAGIDQAEAFVNDPANATASQDNVGQAESNTPSQWNTNFDSFRDSKGPKVTGINKALQIAKKSGPGVGIVGFLIALALGFSTGTMALLPAHIKQMFLNDLSDVTRGSHIRLNKLLAYKMSSGLKGVGICGSKISIRCKFATVSDKYVIAMEDAGFKVNGEKTAFGRTKIKTIELPEGIKSSALKNGTTITSPQEMKGVLGDTKNTELMGRLSRAFNPRSGVYNEGGRFTNTLKALGLNKAPKITGNTTKELSESMDKGTRAVDEDGKPLSTVDKDGNIIDNKDAPNDERMKTVTEEVKTKKGLISGAAGVTATVACSLLETANKIRIGIKTARILATAAFAMAILTAIDQMIAGKSTDNPMSFTNRQLTSIDGRKQVTDPNQDNKTFDNPNYGKSPTDALGYRAAAFNDFGKPDASLAKYVITAGAVGVALDSVFSKIKAIPGGMRTIRTICSFSGNYIVGLIGSAACIGPQIVACVAMMGAGVAMNIAFAKVAENFIKKYGFLALSSATVGPDVLNAMFVGSSSILSFAAADGGMFASSKGEFQKYLVNTKTGREAEIAAQQYEAAQSPFDMTNPYTSVGAMAAQLPLFSINTSSIFSSLTTGLKAIGAMAANPLSPQAYAEYSVSDKEYNAKRFEQLSVDELSDIGADSDLSGNPRMTMSPKDLDAEYEKVLDFMINGGYVDDASTTDSPAATENGKVYQKYLDFCTSKRINGSEAAPWGEDPRSFSEQGLLPDPTEDDWRSGKKCREDSEMLSNFRVFHSDFGIDSAMNQENSGDSPDTGGGGGTVDGDVSSLAKIVLDNSDSKGNQGWDIKGGYSMVGPFAGQDTISRSTVELQLEDIAAGKQASSSTRCSYGVPKFVTPDKPIMQFLADAAQHSPQKGMQFNTLFGQCHMGPGSNHHAGKAADFGCNISSTTLAWLDEAAKKYGVGRNFENCAGQFHWHYEEGH